MAPTFYMLHDGAGSDEPAEEIKFPPINSALGLGSRNTTPYMQLLITYLNSKSIYMKDIELAYLDGTRPFWPTCGMCSEPVIPSAYLVASASSVTT